MDIIIQNWFVRNLIYMGTPKSSEKDIALGVWNKI